MRRIAPILVTFVALAALVAWKEASSGSGSAGRQGPEIALSVPGLSLADVRRIEITPPGGSAPSIVVGRATAEAAWVAEKPFRAPASVGAVEKLVKGLAEADGEIRGEDASQLASFDLTPDRASVIRLLGDGGRVLAHVAVGRSSQRSGAFVRLLGGGADEAQALATTKDLRGLLGLRPSDPSPTAAPHVPDASHFHDKDFPTVDLSKAKRIEVASPGRVVAFERSEKGWDCVQGGPGAKGGPVGDLNAEGVAQIIRSFGPELRTQGLADPSNLAAIGLAEPKWTLSVTLEDGTVRRAFGSVTGGEGSDAKHYVRLDAKQDPDVVFTCATYDWQRLFPAGSGLFRFENMAVRKDALLRIEIAHGSTPIVLVRDGTKPTDDWRVESPAWGLPVRQGEIRSLTALLENVRPVDWSDAADLGPAEATITLGPAAGTEGERTVLRIGGRTTSGKDRLALLPGSAKVLVLADSTVDRLLPAALSLFERAPLHGWSYDDVTAVRVERRDGSSADFAIERDDVAWSIVRGGEKQKGNADEIRPWIERILAATIADVSPPGSAPVAALTFERSDGAPVRIELGADSSGRCPAVIGGGTFTLEGKDLIPDAAKLTSDVK